MGALFVSSRVCAIYESSSFKVHQFSKDDESNACSMDCLLQKFTFVIKHKSSQQNKVVDALSRRAFLLATISTKVVGFDYLKDTYAVDEDFGGIWARCNNKEFVTDIFI